MACDREGNGVLNDLSRTRSVLSQVEGEYYRVARNPLLSSIFNRAKEDLNIIIVEIKDEVGDPIPERSSGPALDGAKADFQRMAQHLRSELEKNGMAYPGSQLARVLEDFMIISRNVDVSIDILKGCWKKAGGK